MEPEQYYDEYEIDLREYIKVLWDGKWLIIGLIIIAVLTAGAYSRFFIEPVYETEAAVEVSNAGRGYSNLEAVVQLLQSDEIIPPVPEEALKTVGSGGVYSDPEDVVRLLQSNKLVKPVMEELEQDFTDAQLKNYIERNIEAVNIEDSDIVEIRVRDTNPERAEKLLEGIVNNFQDDSNRIYHRIIDNKEDQLASIDSNLQSLEDKIEDVHSEIDSILRLEMGPAEKSILINSLTARLEALFEQQNKLMEMEQDVKREIETYHPVREIETPYLPERPVSPNTKLNIAIAGVLALMLSVFIIFFREFMKEDEIQ